MSVQEIHVGGRELVFSAAHFIAFEGGESEHLHGHNYHASASIVGSLREKGYVLDFVAVRDRLQELLAELDHRLLLPGESPWFAIARDGDSVAVEVDGRRYRFPEADVVILPLNNTTSENLAAHLLDRLVESLGLAGRDGLERASLRLEELPGQGATARRDLGAEASDDPTGP
jgi:6-pyruvoyltetrahydropterin/6-carboxytetrahydropterin synthase